MASMVYSSSTRSLDRRLARFSQPPASPDKGTFNPSTGYGGRKSPKPRVQPPTRGPEADETKTKTVALH